MKNEMTDLIDRWLTFKAAGITQSTAVRYRSGLKALALFFKDREVSTITTNDIAAWMDWLMNRRKVRITSGGTLWLVGAAHDFLEWCEDNGLTAANPVVHKKLPKLRENNPIKRPFTYEQYQRLGRSILDTTKNSEMWRAAIAVAWHTGLREGDCAALRWEHISFDDRMITAWPQKKAAYNECLYIPIEPEFYDLLLRRKNKDAPDQRGYVNLDFRTLYLRGGAIAYEFRILCDNIGLPNHSFHSFRHGFVTRLLNAGVDSLIISSITGQSLAIIQEYAHISNDAKHEALSKSRTGPAPMDQPKIEVAM